jgi:MFS transporter, FSR family, fosmidomycin resistance protein
LSTSKPTTGTSLKRVFSGQNLFLLFALSLGHMLMHCFQQGWYIVLPSVKETFGLSDIQYGAIESTRSAANATVQVPSGAVADILRKQWVIVTTCGLVGLGVAYVVLGLAPNYGIVLLASILMGISVALWHPPALSVLSYRLASRRGLAISLHGMGGNIGNAIGPAMIGIIIGAIAWQTASWILAIPMILLALLLWVVLRKVPGIEGDKVGTRQYFSSVIGLLKNKVMLTLVVSNGIRTMGTFTVFTFFSLYCSKDLGFSSAKVGVYYMLMMASGIASQPFLGYLSDRFGRRAVIIPSLTLLGLLQILIVWSGSGVVLALVAICVGLFIYSLGAVIQAAAMDATPARSGGTTIALLMGSSALFQIPSPTIAGWLSESYGTPSVFLYSGALVLVSALVLLLLPKDCPKASS